jgi:hypothetical protein
MFQRDTSPAKIKTATDAVFAQKRPVAIGKDKFTSGPLEVGFTIQDNAVTMNAFFDPNASPYVNGRQLDNIQFVQMGRFFLDSVPLDPLLHNPGLEHQPLVFNPAIPWQFQNGYIDTPRLQVGAQVPPIGYSSWQLLDDEAFDPTWLNRYPQNYGSVVSSMEFGGIPPDNLNGKYRCAFMKKRIDLAQLNLPGTIMPQFYLSIVDINHREAYYESLEGLDPYTATNRQIIERLIESSDIPEQQVDMLLYYALEARVEFGPRRLWIQFDDFESKGTQPIPLNRSIIVFRDNSEEQARLAFIEMDTAEYLEEFDNYLAEENKLHLEALDRMLKQRYRVAIPHLQYGVRCKYQFNCLPCAIENLVAHGQIVGYRIRPFEGFSYSVSRLFDYQTGWDPVGIDYLEELNPRIASARQQDMLMHLRIRIKQDFGEQFVIQFAD